MAKCITVKQPWASLIVEGIMYIKNSTWKTNFRGRVLIHASLDTMLDLSVLTKEQYEYVCEHLEPLPTVPVDRYDRGMIIGSVEIVDCVINHPSIWAEKSRKIEWVKQSEKSVRIEPTFVNPTYNWVLVNPIKFKKPIPAKGKLSFWESQCEILECPNCGGYCLHDNHDVMIRNWGNPVHICEHCSYAILESEFEFLK
jgi:hypothetical protein